MYSLNIYQVDWKWLVILGIFVIISIFFFDEGYSFSWRDFFLTYFTYLIFYFSWVAFLMGKSFKMPISTFHNILFILLLAPPFEWITGFLFFRYKNGKWPEDIVAKNIQNSFTVKKDDDGDEVVAWQNELNFFELSKFIRNIVIVAVISLVLNYYSYTLYTPIIIVLVLTAMFFAALVVGDILHFGRYQYSFGYTKDFVSVQVGSHKPYSYRWDDSIWYETDDKNFKIDIRFKGGFSKITLYCLKDSYKRVKEFVQSKVKVTKSEYLKNKSLKLKEQEEELKIIRESAYKKSSQNGPKYRV